MLIEMRCKNCDDLLYREIQKKGTHVHVMIELNTTDYCESCNHTHINKEELYFCCPECMVAYIVTGDKFTNIVNHMKDGK